MSGGYFDYDQYKINDIAVEVKKLIENNEYNAKTIAEFKTGLRYLEKASIYAQRIDWLVSGDDGEESFHRRLSADIHRIEINAIEAAIMVAIDECTGDVEIKGPHGERLSTRAAECVIDVLKAAPEKWIEVLKKWAM